VNRRAKGPSRLLWKLFLGYAVLTALSLTICVLLIVRQFDRFYLDELSEHLTTQALTLENQVRGRLDVSHTEYLDRIAKELGDREIGGLRITFVAADGTVLGDSQTDITEMEPHRDRDEIRAALESGRGENTRWSNTVKRRLRYVAVRVGTEENVEGVVRVSLGIQTIGARTQAVRRIIWTIAIIAAAATLVFAMALARVWTLPIRRITATAARISRGDLTARAQVRGSDELARLAAALNEMREHLGKQLATIDTQRQTVEALLDQVREGVVVAGPDGRVVLSNPAAARLLHPDDAEEWLRGSWTGRPVEQCVAQHDLQRLLLSEASGRAARLDPEKTKERQSEARADEVRQRIPIAGGALTLLARGSDIVLPGPVETREPGSVQQRVHGRILTLTDITEIARTIQMRTDFVANASHELRTPLSAIRGAVETILNMDLRQDYESATKFLGVIDRHSTRLEALVSDLLDLSHLESAAPDSEPEPVDLHGFLQTLADTWADVAAAGQLCWSCEVPPDLKRATLDARLAGLALDNLVDNAIKFTPAGGNVAITCRQEGRNLAIEVSDDGCGIPKEDRGRVFERFYQVAQARSGTGSKQPEARGTGLGLAIVRHAVAAMRGTVALWSEPGTGTRVTVTIPQPGWE